MSFGAQREIEQIRIQRLSRGFYSILLRSLWTFFLPVRVYCDESISVQIQHFIVWELIEMLRLQPFLRRFFFMFVRVIVRTQHSGFFCSIQKKYAYRSTGRFVDWPRRESKRIGAIKDHWRPIWLRHTDPRARPIKHLIFKSRQLSSLLCVFVCCIPVGPSHAPRIIANIQRAMKIKLQFWLRRFFFFFFFFFAIKLTDRSDCWDYDRLIWCFHFIFSYALTISVCAQMFCNECACAIMTGGHGTAAAAR